jgi:hypothetical protein
LFGSLFAPDAAEAVVDESALRYYASLHNVTRANAEIKRLKALHPNWIPPTNIYAPAGAGNDEQPFWDLLAADRIEELRAGIALRMKSDPAWKPSRDLTVKIERKAAIGRLAAASDANEWTNVLEIADADPSVLHCAYMDANWRVAEAFLKIGQPARAFEIYHAIIATCPDHDDRVTTVRKAIARFSVDQSKSLIAMGAKSRDGAMEFDAVKSELTRARIGAVNSGASTDVIEQSALDEFYVEIARTRDRSDLALAGWYEYGRHHFAEADRWFALGAPAAPPGRDADDIKLAEGHALALLKLNDTEKAMRLAWEWRDVSPAMRRTYVDAMISLLTQPPPAAAAITDSALADFAATLEADRNFEGANALAWFRLNRREWDEAGLWFKAALGWKGVDPGAGPAAGLSDAAIFKAIEGYATALSNGGRLEEAAGIADAWRSAGPSLRELFLSLVQTKIDAADRVDAVGLDRLRHFTEIVSAARAVNAAGSIGWLEYRSGDFPSAIDWFGKSIAWSPNGKGDVKSNQGFALALERLGRFAEAEEIGWAWRRQSADLRGIFIAAVVAQISRADAGAGIGAARLERFTGLVWADHSTLGAQALGWRRLREGNCGYAAPWFRRAAAWSADRDSDPKTAEGLALALSAVGQFREAEDIAYAWRDRSAALRALYVKVGVEALTRELPVAPVDEARMGRFAAIVLADRSSLGAQALAWRRFRQAGCGYGANWFHQAILWADDSARDAKTDEGWSLTLRAVGRLADAEAVAKRWAGKAASMKQIYIDVVIQELGRDNPPEPVEEARLADFVAAIESVKSPLGAQALGWHRFQRGELGEAAKWFEKAIDWRPPLRWDASGRVAAPVEDYKPLLARLALFPSQYSRTPLAYASSAAMAGRAAEPDAGTLEAAAKTAEGYALTLRALGRIEEAERIAYSWRDRAPALRSLFLDIAAGELARDGGSPLSTERVDRYRAAIAEDHSISAASAMGWRLYARGDFAGSLDWFKPALDWSLGASSAAPDPRLVEGYVLALRGARKFDEALAVAARWRDASPRLRALELETTLIALRASGRSDGVSTQKYKEIEAAMIASRSPEGALSVGWIAFQAGDFASALNWFRDAVDWSPVGQADPKALEGLALTLRAAGRYEDLAAFAHQWRDTSPEVRAAYYGGMIEWLTRAEPVADIPGEAREDFQAVVQSDQNPAGAEAIGWSWALRKNWPKALGWFQSALEWAAIDPLAPRPDAKTGKSRAKLIEGLVQALRNVDRLAEAEDVAFAWRDQSDLRGLYMQVFTQELAGPDAAPIPAARVARFARTANDDRSSIGAANMGWLSYRAKDWNSALAWFEHAMAWSPDGKGDAKIHEGYALALSAAGRWREAEDFTFAWADQSPELRAAYIAAVSAQLGSDSPGSGVSAARVERFARVLIADRSAAGARALGWHRLKEGNCAYAAGWFRLAAAWSPADAGDATSATGLALALRAAGALGEASDIAWAWRDRAPALRELFLESGIEALTRDLPPAPYGEPRIDRFAAVVLADHSSAGARALGWRRLGQPGEGYAANWFERATLWTDESQRDPKTDEGHALALRSAGRLAEAEALAKRWADKIPAMKSLYVEIVVDELARDNPPEPLDEARLAAFVATIEPMRSSLGAQALGWYRLERGELAAAAAWFKNAIDWLPARAGYAARRPAAAVADYKPILAKLAMLHAQYRRSPLAFARSANVAGKPPERQGDAPEVAAKTWEGYVLTLRALGRIDEAERLAFEWRDRSPDMRAIFLEMAAAELSRADGATPSPERMERYTAAIVEDRSTAGAAAMAWRLYGRQDFGGAADWFKSAIDWQASGPGAAADPRWLEGYVLALRGAGRFDEAIAFAEKWRGTSSRLDFLYLETTRLGLKASGRTDEATLAKIREVEAAMIRSRSPEGALAIGWTAYESQDYANAATWFRDAIAWSADSKPDPKAIEGEALTLRALGRPEELAAFSRQWRETSPEARSAYYGGMLEWLDRAEPLTDISPATLADFQALVETDRSPIGAQAIGWGLASRKQWPGAIDWFEKALAWRALDPMAPDSEPAAAKSSPKLIEGYVQALRNADRLGKAEDIAFAWRDRPELRGLYMQVFTQEIAGPDAARISAERIARFAKLAGGDHSEIGARNLGWLAYRLKDYTTALAWFERATAWAPGDAVDAKTLEGKALSLRAVGRLAEAEELAFAFRDKSPELRAAFVAAVSDQLAKPELAAKVTPARIDRFADVVRAETSAPGARAMGWLRLQDGHCGYAVPWFRAALAWDKDHKDDDTANSGLAQGLRGVGMYNEAEDIAYAGRDRSRELRALYFNIGVEELTRPWPRVEMSEFRLTRFGEMALADHSGAAAQALGWRRYSEAACGYGAQWFRLAAAWSSDARGDAKLNEGYAQTLRASGRLARAEAIAAPWIDRQDYMKKLYIDVVVEELSRDDPPEPMPEPRLAYFVAAISANHSALGAQALAWYRFARGENAEAVRWFRNALDWWPHPKPDSDAKLSLPADGYHAILAALALRPEDYRRTPRAYPNSSMSIGKSTESFVDTAAGLAKTIEGYVQALRAAGRLEEAEQLAFDWRDRWPRLRDLFIDIAIAELGADGGANLPADRLDRMIAIIEGDHSARGAEALAWRAYAAKDNATASRWFKSRFDWAVAGKDPAPNSNLVQAYASALSGADHRDEALRLLDAWRDKWPDLQAIYVQIGLDDVQSLDPSAPETARRLADLAVSVEKTKSASGATSLGWLGYQRKEYAPALAWFKQAILWTPAGTLPDAKALEGYARALQAQQRYADFLTFASEWSERVPALKPLFLEAASQALSAAAAGGQDIATDVLVRAGAAFAGARSAAGAQALAWQRIAVKDWVAAAAWFQAARTWSGADTPDPKIDEGWIIALRNLHRDDEAEALAYAGAAKDENLRELYIETVSGRLTRAPPSPPDEAGMRRFAEFVAAAKSPGGAQALGWYSYNARQWPAAIAWFGKSMDWNPSEDAALGLALAQRQSGDRAAYAAVIAAYGPKFAKVADLAGGRVPKLEERRAALETGDAPAPGARAPRAAKRARAEAAAPARSDGSIDAALNAKDYAACVSRADEIAAKGALGGEQQSALGWCLLNLQRPAESARAFDAALHQTQGKAHQDAAYGKSLALLASGEAAPAGLVAAQGNLAAERRNAVGVEILAKRAWDAFGARHYAEAVKWLDRRAAYTPETRDLMDMRARCLEQLGQTEASEKIRNDLDAQLAP